jgi:flagellar biosynthesis protein FlhF
MKVIPFIAESAADAVTQIRAKLGPEAIVVNVRQLPAEGLARLWQKPRIEVLAYRPESSSVPAPETEPPISQAPKLRESPIPPMPPMPEPLATREAPLPAEPTFGMRPLGAARPEGGWRVGVLLEDMGFLPLYAQQVMQRLKAMHGERPPESLTEELHSARALLATLWRSPKSLTSAAPMGATGPGEVHILIGAPGVGKTTCLCKWLVQSALIEGRPVRVWRLDGRTANTAETVSVFCEMLKVPIERLRPTEPTAEAADLLLIDLPGVPWNEAAAVQELGQQLKTLPLASVHLVLNAAYELPTLLAQVNAFSSLPIQDLIFTHLDEEQRWGKLWNFVLGTNYSISHLSAGQNIPGGFFSATASLLLARQFALK